MKKIFVMLLILIFIISPLAPRCYAVWWWDGSTADITSFKDPTFSGYKISKIMFCSMEKDLREKNQIEEKFVKKFSNNKFLLDPVSSLKFILPTKQYTIEDFNKIMNDNNIRSVMVITIIGSYNNQSYIPETSFTTISGYVNGNNLNATQNTVKNGGYYVSTEDLKFELRILDVATGNTVWLANSLASGTPYSSFNNLIAVVIKKTFKQMQKDGLLNEK